VQRENDLFLINNIPNRINLSCGEFVLNEDDYNCDVVEDIEHAINCLTEKTQRYDRRNIGGRWLNVRYTYEDVDDTEMNTQFIEWEDMTPVEVHT
jgi:hypothetical protein